MGTAAKTMRENRTITVDFRDEATYFHLLEDGKAFSRVCPRLRALSRHAAQTQGDL